MLENKFVNISVIKCVEKLKSCGWFCIKVSFQITTSNLIDNKTKEFRLLKIVKKPLTSTRLEKFMIFQNSRAINFQQLEVLRSLQNNTFLMKTFATKLSFDSVTFCIDTRTKQFTMRQL